MGWLSTEAVISSFGALLSTALSGSYSQGLIHRNRLSDCTTAEGNPLRERESARHWRKELEMRVQTGREWACLVTAEGLFTDAEAGKDPAEQVIGAECPGDFAQ